MTPLIFSLFFSSTSIIAISLDDNGEDGPKMKRDGNRVILSSDNFNIEVNAKGTVPFYHFNTSMDTAKFFLKFNQIVQFNDTDNNSKYDSNEAIGTPLSLASVDWDFENTTESDASVEFAFRSSNIQKQDYQNTEIALINHFTGEHPSVKFDIFVSNWPFESEATGLVLEFSLTWSRSGGNGNNNETQGSMKLNKESNDTTILLKNDDNITLAYFESINDIVADGISQEDAATLYDDAPAKASKMTVFIVYPRFENNLTHDPAFASTQTAVESTGTPSGGIDGFLAISSALTLAFAAVVIRNLRRR